LAERVVRIGAVLFTAFLLVGVALVMGRFYASASGSSADAQVLSVASAEIINAPVTAPAFVIENKNASIARQFHCTPFCPHESARKLLLIPSSWRFPLFDCGEVWAKTRNNFVGQPLYFGR